jgi:ribosomal protein S18 acetylase RimI-like enzyme
VDERWSVIQADRSGLDAVAPLFQGMVEHHRRVTAGEWPVRQPTKAWERRRRQYEAWLEGDHGWLFLALPVAATDLGTAVGYAFVRVHEPGATWDLGEAVGELESLAVAEHARGGGVGTELIERARELLRNRGIRYWSVAVVTANTGAVRLYEREGFRPYYSDMLGEI